MLLLLLHLGILVVDEVLLVLDLVHGGGLVMDHHLLLLGSRLIHVRNVTLDWVEAALRILSHFSSTGSILRRDRVALHLLNYLFHVLTRELQLLEILLKLVVVGLERDNFLGELHTLDTGQQVVRHVVGQLENAVLLRVDLSHARVIDLIECFFLFDEVLHATQALMHPSDRLLDRDVWVFQVALVVLSAWVAVDLARRRVSHEVTHVGFSVFGDAALAQGPVVSHAKHID